MLIACEVKAHLIRCWPQNLGAVCFWQPIPSGLNLVVAAVLQHSLCVVSLLPCMADYCMSYTVCKVERFVLTIIKGRLLSLLEAAIISGTTACMKNGTARLLKGQIQLGPVPRNFLVMSLTSS